MLHELKAKVKPKAGPTKLKIARLMANLFQKDLARDMGVTRSRIAQWENDLSPIPADRKMQLAGALGVPVEMLFPEAARKKRDQGRDPRESGHE